VAFLLAGGTGFSVDAVVFPQQVDLPPVRDVVIKSVVAQVVAEQVQVVGMPAEPRDGFFEFLVQSFDPERARSRPRAASLSSACSGWRTQGPSACSKSFPMTADRYRNEDHRVLRSDHKRHAEPHYLSGS